MTRQEIGEKVRTQRALRGWGQAELAQRLGTSVPTVSRMENGLYDVTFQEVLALAGIFQMSLQMFVDSPPMVPSAAADMALLASLMRVAGRLPRPVLRQIVELAKAFEQTCVHV